LLLGRAVAAHFFQDVQWEHMRALLDPFGFQAFAMVTKYWTVAAKNSLAVGFSGLLLWNRLIWIGVGSAAFALAYSRFSFTERRTKSKALEPVEQPGILPVEAPRPHTQLAESPTAKFLGSVNIHFRGMAKNTVFVVVLIIGCVFCILGLVLEGTQFQGNQTYQTFPVTYLVIDLIRGTLDFFLVIIIIYFAGALVWKDGDDRFDEIADATPTPDWVSYASRLATLIGMVMVIQAVALVAGIVFQSAHGYHRFQFGFENNVSNPEVVQNGTFLNNFVATVIGYNYLREVSDPLERKKFGLQELTSCPRGSTTSLTTAATFSPGTQTGSTSAPSSVRRPIKLPLPRLPRARMAAG